MMSDVLEVKSAGIVLVDRYLDTAAAGENKARCFDILV